MTEGIINRSENMVITFPKYDETGFGKQLQGTRKTDPCIYHLKDTGRALCLKAVI